MSSVIGHNSNSTLYDITSPIAGSPNFRQQALEAVDMLDQIIGSYFINVAAAAGKDVAEPRRDVEKLELDE
jgi:hypothetical protein